MSVRTKSTKRNKETKIRLPEVLSILPVGKTTFYAGIKSGIYPAGKSLTGKRAVGWKLSTIEKIARVGVAGGQKRGEQ